MRIRELELINYRPFRDSKFELTSGFTVIAGVNGRGKTSLLDGLAQLLSRFLPLISPARGGYRKFSPGDIYDGAPKTNLKMKVNCAGIPVEYELFYERFVRGVETTHLPAILRHKIRYAY